MQSTSASSPASRGSPEAPHSSFAKFGWQIPCRMTQEPVVQYRLFEVHTDLFPGRNRILSCFDYFVHVVYGD